MSLLQYKAVYGLELVVSSSLASTSYLNSSAFGNDICLVQHILVPIHSLFYCAVRPDVPSCATVQDVNSLFSLIIPLASPNQAPVGCNAGSVYLLVGGFRVQHAVQACTCMQHSPAWRAPWRMQWHKPVTSLTGACLGHKRVAGKHRDIRTVLHGCCRVHLCGRQQDCASNACASGLQHGSGSYVIFGHQGFLLGGSALWFAVHWGRWHVLTQEPYCKDPLYTAHTEQVL